MYIINFKEQNNILKTKRYIKYFRHEILLKS